MKPEIIKPSVKGKSDFFSWQLYRYMKKHPNSVIYKTDDDFLGVGSPALMIGDARDGDWIHCRSLKYLCSRGARLERMAYGADHNTRKWVDISNEFWDDYLKRGVCAIHEDLAHNWIVDEEVRVCSYCAKKELRKTKLVEITYWEEA